LREYEDALEFRVQTIADGNVDEAVLAGERHRRLRTHVRQREEARPATATKDQSQHVVHG
jgi:hypothetical protein